MKKLLFFLVIFLTLGGSAFAQGTLYQLSPPAPNARVLVCPSPDNGYPCPVQAAIFSDAALTQAIAQPVNLGSGGFFSFYVASGTYVIQLTGPGYNSGNRQVVTIGGGLAANSPVPQAQVGPGFNVANYTGVKGDAQFSAANCTMSTGVNTMTCPGANFSASKNIGQRANCGSGLGGGFFFATGSTITGVNSPTVAVISSVAGANSSGGSCAWGTPDDAAVAPAVTAWKAAISYGPGSQSAKFNNANSPSSPVLYFPSRAYMFCGTTNLAVISMTASQFGATIQGDTQQETWFIPCDTAANSGSQGFFIDQASGGGGLLIRNIAFDGIYMGGVLTPPIQLAGEHHVENMSVTRWNGAAGFVTAGSGYNLNLTVNNSTSGITCNACSDEFHGGGSSNNGTGAGAVNLTVNNTAGLNVSTGPRFTGNFLVDECGAGLRCTVMTNAQDVWFQGASLFSTPGGSCMQLSGNSIVHFNGGICGVFGTDTNSGGPLIDAGSTLLESDVRNVGTGTAKCITNNGILLDNGGNTCESMFPIASGTSTGTTAVLTLTSAGAAVNTNCSVGDALVVENAAIAGYDGYYPAGATSGITATSATTLTYTTIGSNLGALGAGGVAFCRNLQSYSGTLPRALLTPSWNTCYVTITPIVNATNYLMCNQFIDRPINIARIKASSQNTTTCATAPIITISDGTASVTLTLTTAKSSWDSTVDTSTGVGTTIFKPNGTITVRYDVAAASACATPPTQLAVTYNSMGILSN